MKEGPAVTIGLDCKGRVVIGVTKHCGCVIERTLSDAEAQQVLDALAKQIAVARRVQMLPLPWIHDAGQA